MRQQNCVKLLMLASPTSPSGEKSRCPLAAAVVLSGVQSHWHRGLLDRNWWTDGEIVSPFYSGGLSLLLK